jgi:hypothetical protein
MKLNPVALESISAKEGKDELLLASVQLTTRCLPFLSFSIKATIDKLEQQRETEPRMECEPEKASQLIPWWTSFLTAQW